MESTTRRWQIGLVAVGLVMLAFGAITLLDEVGPENYLGIATWFFGALVLHDGVAAVAVFAVGVVLRKAGRRIPVAVLAILQGALAIAAMVSALVLPAIVKRAIGTANPTILPLDYAVNLGFFYAGLAVLTGLAILGYFATTARRQKLRPSLSQD
ncbi:hypothetical protein BH11ACT4_BH11ACT4_23410 [soil metagenome]